MLSFGFRIFCWYRGFCHRTGSDLLLFLSTHIFPFLPIFSQNFDYFTPKRAIFAPIQLGIIANIVSWIKNYQYAKFRVFLKKVNH